ncbi:MAG: hypothetical protein ACXADB_01785 [Candidatus Hermodarchaeia archaeon]|jgi:hypothetical protein
MRLKTRKVITIAIGLCFLLALASFSIGTSTARQGPRTYFVAASGDTSGVTDTLQIQTAFDNAVEHRGSTVKLGPGTFYLNKEIVVINFDGTFKGAGKGNTIIQNTEDHPFPLLSDPIWGLDGPQQVGFALMFLFYQNAETESTAHHPYTIKISDMTFRVVGQSEEWQLPGWPEFLPNPTSINPIMVAGIARMEYVEGEISYFNLFCRGLEFEGIISDSYFLFGSSAANGIQFCGSNWLYMSQLTGIFSVKDCTFKSICCGICALGVFKDSLLLVQHNTFDGVSWGMELYPGNMLCIIVNNDMHGVGTLPSLFGGFGIFLVQQDAGPGKILIIQNTIECADEAIGMLLDDVTTSLSGCVICNTIILEGPNAMGILNFCSEDVKFHHNPIIGP